MSSIVVVKKAGKAVIAADSLTTFGRTKFGKKYQRNPEKIHKFESSYIGLVGDAAHSNVFENIIDRFAKELRFDSRKHIFETYLNLHQILKDKFHLNPDAAEDVAYQSSQIDALIANENGPCAPSSISWMIRRKLQKWELRPVVNLIMPANCP